MKKFLLILLSIAAIVLIAVFAISEKYHFEKTVLINAPAEKVYPHISSTKAFDKWNPWLKIDPAMKMVYTGTQGQIGDRYCWDSKNDEAGAGCQEIVELVPNRKQKTRMEFKRPFEDTSYSEVILTPRGNQTSVTWTLDSKLERPMNLMKIFMNSAMDKSYSDGLAELKALSEK